MPNGKALDSDSSISRFEPSSPGLSAAKCSAFCVFYYRPLKWKQPLFIYLGGVFITKIACLNHFNYVFKNVNLNN